MISNAMDAINELIHMNLANRANSEARIAMLKDVLKQYTEMLGKLDGLSDERDDMIESLSEMGIKDGPRYNAINENYNKSLKVIKDIDEKMTSVLVTLEEAEDILKNY